jgi:hypothetical protein
MRSAVQVQCHRRTPFACRFPDDSLLVRFSAAEIQQPVGDIPQSSESWSTV